MSFASNAVAASVSVAALFLGCAPSLSYASSSPSSLSLRPPPSPPRTTNRPVIGILSVPLKEGGDCVTSAANSFPVESYTATDKSSTSCFDNLYVKWVEAAGGRVVPIRFDSEEKELDRLFDNLNGVLFTGGDTVITDLTSPYMKAAGHLLNRSIAAFVNEGDYVPVWGTCMGIQTLSVLVAQDPAVLTTGFEGTDPLMMPLNLTAAAQQSRMFGSFSDEVKTILVKEPVTTNLHHDGVNPEVFRDNDHLAAFFDVLSTNVSPSDQPFTSTIEGKTVPVYGVQWHPERPQFEWTKVDPTTGQDPINHDYHGIIAMQSFANFYVQEARRNNHSWPSEDQLYSELIYNYQVQGTRDYAPYFFAPASSS